MPLLNGHTPEVISQNISELRKSGKPENQATAIAMKLANKARKASKEKTSDIRPDRS